MSSNGGNLVGRAHFAYGVDDGAPSNQAADINIGNCTVPVIRALFKINNSMDIFLFDDQTQTTVFPENNVFKCNNGDYFSVKTMPSSGSNESNQLQTGTTPYQIRYMPPNVAYTPSPPSYNVSINSGRRSPGSNGHQYNTSAGRSRIGSSQTFGSGIIFEATVTIFFRLKELVKGKLVDRGFDVPVTLREQDIRDIQALNNRVGEVCRQTTEVADFGFLTLKVYRPSGTVLLDNDEMRRLPFWEEVKKKEKSKQYYFVVGNRKLTENNQGARADDDSSDDEIGSTSGYVKKDDQIKNGYKKIKLTVKDSSEKIVNKLDELKTVVSEESENRSLLTEVYVDAQTVKVKAAVKEMGNEIKATINTTIETSVIDSVLTAFHVKGYLQRFAELFKCKLCLFVCEQPMVCSECARIVACKKCIDQERDRILLGGEDDDDNRPIIKAQGQAICPNCQYKFRINQRGFEPLNATMDLDQIRLWYEKGLGE